MINYEDAIVDKSQPRTETEKIQIKPTKKYPRNQIKHLICPNLKNKFI